MSNRATPPRVSTGESRGFAGIERLKLKLLGSPMFETPGSSPVDADHSPLAFALLLRLAIDAGKPVPRSELARLVWGEDSPRTRGRLRVLFSRLRELRIPVRTTSHTALLESPIDWDEAGDGALLTGFAAPTSEFEHWIDGQRAGLVMRYIRPRLVRLEKAHAAGDWPAVASIARSIAAIDPLNEVANLSIGEALAFMGSKTRALAHLDEYLAAIGADRDTLRRPIDALQRRIQTATQEPAGAVDASALLERETLLGRINDSANDANAAALTQGIVLTGPSGIGKSTLLRAAADRLRIAGWHVVSARALPSEQSLPYSLVHQVAPAILGLPYAAGAPAEAVSHLRTVVSGIGPAVAASQLARQTAAAIGDVLSAVATERPVALLIDDVQWLDYESRRVVEAIVADQAGRRVLWLLAERASGASWPGYFQSSPVPPLTPAAAFELFQAVKGEDAGAPLTEAERRAIAAAAGRPLWVRALAARARCASRDGISVHADLDELLIDETRRLPEGLRDLMRFIALLGPMATMSRLRALYSRRTSALRRLLEEGSAQSLILSGADGTLVVHDSWASALVLDQSAASLQCVHAQLFALLGREAESPSAPTELIWAIVHHARMAEALKDAAEPALALADRLAAAGTARAAARLLDEVISMSHGDSFLMVRLVTRAVTILHDAQEYSEILRLAPLWRAQLVTADEESVLLDVFEASARLEKHRELPSHEICALIGGIGDPTDVVDSGHLALLDVAIRMHAAGVPGNRPPWRRFREMLRSPDARADKARHQECVLRVGHALRDKSAVSASAEWLLRHLDRNDQRIPAREQLRIRRAIVAAYIATGRLSSAESLAAAFFERDQRTDLGSTVADFWCLFASAYIDAGRWPEAEAAVDAAKQLRSRGDVAASDSASAVSLLEASLTLRIHKREFGGFQSDIDAALPGVRPRALAARPLNERSVLASLEVAVVAAVGDSVAPWRDEIVEALDHFELLNGHGALHSTPEGVVWRLAVAAAAVGERNRSLQLLDEYGVARAGDACLFPFEKLRRRVAVATPLDLIARTYWDRRSPRHPSREHSRSRLWHSHALQ